MRSRILFLLRARHLLNYLGPVVETLLSAQGIELFFIAGNDRVAGDIRERFAGNAVLLEMEPRIIDETEPDIIITCDIWFMFTGLLKRAREKNIPILMYDHGSLYHICEYHLENDEFTTAYRASLGLCSHIACWGEYGRDCWASYGVSKEKMTVTGAIQYDHLYRHKTPEPGTASRDFYNETYARLNVQPGKKIILLYSTLHHPHPHWRKRNIDVTRQLENFVRNREEYQLVVKHHPLTAHLYPKCPYP
ncbi:MAG: glycosyltransferase, partial [bacterium]|nr:glycosyltransferase [bacterium]